MTSPLVTILTNGYFPKELPPPFNTKLFGTFAETAPSAFYLDTTKKGSKGNLVSRPAVHNLARTGTLRRKLTIPNPVSQYQVARAIAEGWRELKAACSMSPISLTTPRYRKIAPARLVLEIRLISFLPRGHAPERHPAIYSQPI